MNSTSEHHEYNGKHADSDMAELAGLTKLLIAVGELRFEPAHSGYQMDLHKIRSVRAEESLLEILGDLGLNVLDSRTLSFALLGGSGLFFLLVELLLLLLEVAIFQILFGLLKIGITFIFLFITLLLDLLKRHADDSLLEAGGFSSLLTLDLVNLDFLIESPPGLGPGELDWLNLLVVKGSNL